MAYLNEAAGKSREMNSTNMGAVGFSGAVVAGTSEVWTLTIGGTPTGGTFTLKYKGKNLSAVTWSATNATLLANLNAALDAYFGTGNCVAAAGSLTAGIGTITLTFSASLQKLALTGTFGTPINNLTGTAPTVAIAETTPGVTATGRGTHKGTELVRTDTGVRYVNTGTAISPTLTVTGAQT